MSNTNNYNYYNYFLYDIKSLINNFGFIPHWIDINDEKFLNHTSKSYKDFDTNDKFLQKYSKEKIGLAKDIIENGTYAPFFFFKDKSTLNNLLIMGKHRLYSLLLYSKQFNIQRKFLFIECPTDPCRIGKYSKNKIIKPNGMMYNYDVIKKDIPELINIYNCDYAFYIILCTGDKLSNWFYDNNIKPSEVINNEELFNKFINEPFTLPLTM